MTDGPTFIFIMYPLQESMVINNIIIEQKEIFLFVPLEALGQ